MIPHSIRRLSLSFCLALALATGGVAAPAQGASAATALAPAQKPILTAEKRAKIAEESSQIFGFTGEKDKVIRDFFPNYLEAMLRNKSFNRLMKNAKSEAERNRIRTGWMHEHAKRNLYRLSYTDQRAFMVSMLASLKAMPDADACYDFLNGDTTLKLKLDFKTLTFGAYELMSDKDFKDYFNMLLHAATIEDVESLPPPVDEKRLEKSVDALYARMKANFYRNYSKAQADALWAYHFERETQDTSVICNTEIVFYEELLATRGENARILMQYIANSLAEPLIQNGYPF